jgi:hypothetical protein
MTAIDPFEYDDAAYVLGALSDGERAAFQNHLATCVACSARVSSIANVPALLASVTAADLVDEAAPDTLLPGLLKRAGAHRRRQRWLVSGLAGVAAASVLALVVLVWPSSSASTPTPRAMSAVAASPVHATAALSATSWGTEIYLRCRYDAGVTSRIPYRLVVVDKHGQSHDLGSWTLPPDRAVDYTSGTSLSADQISRVEITLPDGTSILRLST